MSREPYDREKERLKQLEKFRVHYARLKAENPGMTMDALMVKQYQEEREESRQIWERGRAAGTFSLWFCGILAAGAALALAIAMPQAVIVEILLAVIVLALL